MRPSLTRRNILVGRIPRGERESVFHVIGKATVSQVQVGDTSQTEFVICDQSIDVNHGFAKTRVINSEVNKKREALEKRCANVQRFREAAREKAHRASVLTTKLWKQAKGRGEEVYRVLNDRLQALEAQGVTEGTEPAKQKKLKAETD